MDRFISPEMTPVSLALSPADIDALSVNSMSPSRSPRSRSPGYVSPRASLGIRNKEVPSTSLYNPDNWKREYNQLSRKILRKSEYVALFPEKESPLNSSSYARLVCCVRMLPSLEAVKKQIKKSTLLYNRTNLYDSLDGVITEIRGVTRSESPRRYDQDSLHREDEEGENARLIRNDVDSYYAVKHSFLPNPTMWSVGGVNENEITVVDAITGRRLLRIRDPKMNVSVTSMIHAPFRGFIDRNINVVPIRQQTDITRLKESQLIETDYVWMGLADGSVRLFPANHNKIRQLERCNQLGRGGMVDIVYELPKYHNSSIVSIVRSPCHGDDEGFNLSTSSRLSSAIRYMSAASISGSEKEREHLSLMCTASVDSTICIWDVRKIYFAIEKLRKAHEDAENAQQKSGTHSDSRAFTTNDAITIDGFHPSYSMRSLCHFVSVRPLMKLKGGIVGLRTMNWVSSLVTTDGYKPPRNVAQMTRDAEEQSAPPVVKERRVLQLLTRFEKREEHRRVLDIEEWEMKEIEEELKKLLPPLSEEPSQSMRINLLIAGDGTGSVHFWNLDEEIRAKSSVDIRDASPSKSPARNGARQERSVSKSVVSTSINDSSVHHDDAGLACAPVHSLKSKKSKTRGDKGTSTPSRSTRTSGTRSSTKLNETPARSSTKKKKQEGGFSFPLSSAKKPRKSSHQDPLGGASPGAAASPKERKSVARGSTGVPVLSKASTGTQPRGSLLLDGHTTNGNTHEEQTIFARRSVHHTEGTRKSGRFESPAKEGRNSGQMRHSESPGLSPSKGSTVNTMYVKKRTSGKKSPSTSPGRTSGKLSDPAAGRRSSQGRSPSRMTTSTLDDNFAPRTAMCRLDFTGGVAINGMGVELPANITTTLRRIQDPDERLTSLLEDPSPEEMERRFLENSFEMLTEEKALYFVFQRLQLYIAVEGTVLNVRCLPSWKLLDDDGRTLFKDRILLSEETSKRTNTEEGVNGAVQLPWFDIQFKKLVLEGHSQPVTNLYLDNVNRQVWVSRNDGLLSVFSMNSKRVITRLAHPSAEYAMVAGSYTLWQAEQDAFFKTLKEGKGHPLKLEWHPETDGYPPNHFTSITPFVRKSSPAFIMFVKEKQPDRSFYRNSSLGDDYYLDFPSMRISSSSFVWTVDSRPAKDRLAIDAREGNMSRFIEQLRYVHENANVVRKAQKEYYELCCDLVVRNVSIIVNALGMYIKLPVMYKLFNTWKQQIEAFPHEHVLKRARAVRISRSKDMASALDRNVKQQLIGRYLVKWLAFKEVRIQKKRTEILQHLERQFTRPPRTLPSAKMMEHLYETNLRRNTFAMWLQYYKSISSPSISRMGSLDATVRSCRPSLSRAGSPFSRTSTSRFIRTKTRQPSITPTSNVISSSGNLAPFSQLKGMNSTHNIPLDTLFAILKNLWNARAFIMRFKETTGGVLDESWFSLVESAEASADSDSDASKRQAVFSYGLLPLLQGLLASADDVLPTLSDPTVADEVLSMLSGVELCLDYVVADAEQFCNDMEISLHTTSQPQPRSSGRLSGTLNGTNTRGSGLLGGGNDDVWVPPGQAFQEDAVMKVLHFIVPKAVKGDSENIRAVREIMAGTESFDAFLVFVTNLNN